MPALVETCECGRTVFCVVPTALVREAAARPADAVQRILDDLLDADVVAFGHVASSAPEGEEVVVVDGRRVPEARCRCGASWGSGC